MKPDDMNTINENGTAFNGNFSPVFLASAFVLLIGFIGLIKLIF